MLGLPISSSASTIDGVSSQCSGRDLRKVIPFVDCLIFCIYFYYRKFENFVNFYGQVKWFSFFEFIVHILMKNAIFCIICLLNHQNFTFWIYNQVRIFYLSYLH
jgi:hypothetical protein